MNLRLSNVGVVYIGDRAAGKTHLALELINPKSEYVKVINQDYENLELQLMDGYGRTKPTEAQNPIYKRALEVQVRLPAGNRSIYADWVDTPGEVWRQSWQRDNPHKWREILRQMGESNGIFLVLPPHRGMSFKEGVEIEDFMTQNQWCSRFDRWVDFFQHECPNLRHLVICLNKADLFCDVLQEGKKLGYNPNGSQMNWQQRHVYALERYFRPVSSQLQRVNQTMRGVSLRCFITSIQNRSLLELPWIYMGSFLAK